MKAPRPLKLSLSLPPGAAAVFLAACAMSEQTPAEFALDALKQTTCATFTAVGLTREIEAMFDASDVESGQEVAP